MIATIVACLVIVGQGFVCYYMLKMVSSFGSYTERLMEVRGVLREVHLTNIQIIERNEEILEAYERHTKERAS